MHANVRFEHQLLAVESEHTCAARPSRARAGASLVSAPLGAPHRREHLGHRQHDVQVQVLAPSLDQCSPGGPGVLERRVGIARGERDPRHDEDGC